jgi:N-glycosylase/DNA lyase
MPQEKSVPYSSPAPWCRIISLQDKPLNTGSTVPTLTLHQDQPFNLDATLGCGQVFRWDRTADGWWYGVVGSRVIKIRQDKDELTYTGVPESFIRHYFSLDLDLAAILASIDCDSFIHEAIRRNRGLRVVRQLPWECTVSYICSTNSNIPTIRHRIASIAEKYGNPIEFEGKIRFTFPDPLSISCRGYDGLTDCRLGYRQTYVFGTSCLVTEEKAWEETIRRLSYEDAKKELMKLHGIGPKASDCILLFAFQKYNAFPVDIWIRRIMQNYLPDLMISAPLTTREYNMICQFAREHFGEYCGWAQEYLYATREG